MDNIAYLVVQIYRPLPDQKELRSCYIYQNSLDTYVCAEIIMSNILPKSKYSVQVDTLILLVEIGIKIT